MSVVFVKSSCIVSLGGRRTNLVRGDAWDSRANVVKKRPELFVDEPPYVNSDREPRVSREPESSPEVETASQAPGEKRRGRPRLPRDAQGNVIRE